MALHRAVGSLVLVDAGGRHQHGGHHGQVAVGRGHHVGHDIPVIILAGPDEASLGADYPGHRIVYQGIEILDAQRLELLLVLRLKNLLKDILERMIIFLGNGVLSGEPQILLCVYCIGEASPGKAFDGLLRIVDALEDARSGELMNQLPDLDPVRPGEHQLSLARPGHLDLRILVHIAVCMAGDGDRLGPVLHIGHDAVDQDGGAEYRAVQDGADGAVGALPHLLQVIFLHPGSIGGDGGAFHGHSILQRGVGGVHRDLVVRGIAVLQP